MSFLFSKSARKFQEYTEKGWLYFFLTCPQPNDRQAFIKFGRTERTLSKRLSSYNSLDLANIYAIHIQENEIAAREGAMKQIFKVCKNSKNIDIWSYIGHEYLKGDLILMLKVFLHFCTIPYDKALMYYSKRIIIDDSEMLEWLDDLHHIEHYNIQMITPIKIHKIESDINNIKNISEIEYNTVKKDDSDSDSDSDSDIVEDNIADKVEETHLCDKCGKLCKDKRGLSIHMRVCPGTKDFICQYCNISFSSVYSLSIHSTRCSKHKENIKTKDNILIEENQRLKKQIEILESKKKEEKCYLEVLSKDDEIYNLKSELKVLTSIIEDREILISDLYKRIEEERKQKIYFLTLSSKKFEIDK